MESPLIEVTGVDFSTGNVEVGREEDTLNGEDCDCDIPGIEMLVVLITVGSLVLVAAGIKEKAVVAVEAKAGAAEVVDAAVVVAKALEVPVGWNPEKLPRKWPKKLPHGQNFMVVMALILTLKMELETPSKLVLI